MKLRYTDGCTCTSLQVDGKEFNLELSLDERRNIARKILEVTTSPEVLYHVYYQYLVDNTDFGDTKSFDDVCKIYDKIYENCDIFTEKSIETQKDEALKYFDTIKDDCVYQDIFCTFLEYEGTGGYLYTCGCCGDSVYEYKIMI